MSKLISYFVKISLKKFILFSFTITISLNLIISIALSYIDVSILNIDFLKNKSLFFIFITTVLIAPILETLIYQYGVIELTLKIKNKNRVIIAVLASSLLFCLSHPYNLFYIFATFILGLCFAIFYMISKSRKDTNPYWFLVALHALINLIAFIINDIF